MIVNKSKRLSFAGSNWAAMFLVVCFGITVLLGSPIHDHDLDLTDQDLDCVSCFLVDATVGMEQDKQVSKVNKQKNYSVSIKILSAVFNYNPSPSSRAPPVIC